MAQQQVLNAKGIHFVSFHHQAPKESEDEEKVRRISSGFPHQLSLLSFLIISFLALNDHTPKNAKVANLSVSTSFRSVYSTSFLSL